MKKDERRSIKTLGSAREVILLNKEKNQKYPGEIFFTIEKKKGKAYKTVMHGYMGVTPEMSKIMDGLIQDRREHIHVSIIEWDDSYNVVFEDGVHISSISCRMEKCDYEAWEKTIRKVKKEAEPDTPYRLVNVVLRDKDDYDNSESFIISRKYLTPEVESVLNMVESSWTDNAVPNEKYSALFPYFNVNEVRENGKEKIRTKMCAYNVMLYALTTMKNKSIGDAVYITEDALVYWG